MGTVSCFYKRLLLGSAGVVFALYGYGSQPAFAGSCTPSGVEVYACSGASAIDDVTQHFIFSSQPITFLTSAGFGIEARAGDAFYITSTGSLTFTDMHGSAITGGQSGITLRNTISGALTMKATGTITSLAEFQYGINAYNDGTDLTIDVNNVIGSYITIFAINFGTGALRITSTGTIMNSGDYASIGIDASNYNSGTDLAISVVDVTSDGDTAILANNYGSGSLTVTSTGTIQSTSEFSTGIHASNILGTNLSVDAVNVTAGSVAISASNNNGSMSITTRGLVTAGADGIGILAYDGNMTAALAHTITINAGSLVQGGRAAISLGSVSGVSATTIVNRGTIQNLSGLSTDVVFSGIWEDMVPISPTPPTPGWFNIDNHGLITGTVDFRVVDSGSGTQIDNFDDIFVNHGVWNTAGGANDFGGGNDRFTNIAGGTVIAAGNGAITETTFFNNLERFENAGTLTLKDSGTGDIAHIPGTYVSNGGTIELDTVLGDDSSATDSLEFGKTVLGSGATRVVVNNINGAGALTVNGIRIIDVLTPAASAADAFTLAGDYITPDGQQAVVGGAYAYTLHQNGVSTPADGRWYLRSSLKPDDPEPGPGPNPEPIEPRYQPGVPLYEAYPHMLHSLNNLSTLYQRTGNRYWGSYWEMPANDMATSPMGSSSYSSQGDVMQGAWGRVEGSQSQVNPDLSTSQSRYKMDRYKVQAGVDVGLHEAKNGSLLLGGITAHYGRASAKMSNRAFGYGDIDTDAYGLGATLTWYGGSGFYVDGQAQITWFDSDLKTRVAGILNPKLADSNDGMGYALSLEAGQRFQLGNGFIVTPQVQLTWSSVDFDSFTDVFDARISNHDRNDLQGRVGVSVERENSWVATDGTTSRYRLYGITNLYGSFLDGISIKVSGAEFRIRDDRVSAGVGLGGTFNWNNDKYSLYGEVDIKTGLENFGDSYALGGTVGLKVKF